MIGKLFAWWCRYWYGPAQGTGSATDYKLTKSEWLDLDAAVIRAARARLRSWGDVTDARDYISRLPKYPTPERIALRAFNRQYFKAR